MKKILSSIPLPGEVTEKYSDEFVLDCPAEGETFSISALTAKIADADGYLGGPLTREMIDGAARLTIASSFGAGYDTLDHRYAGERGILVMNAPHGTTEPTAELTITLLLCLSRRIFNFQNLLRKNGSVGGFSVFVRPFDGAPQPTTVYGKTVGIVGLGKIGRSVAKKAQGLGMKVVYFNVNRLPESAETAAGVTYLPFEELLKTADYVTLHCPYTPENHHMMDAVQFKMMKPTAYFINSARGKLVNESALADVLKGGGILGAALDVFEFEPMVLPELLTLPNVVLTPHIGTGTYESRLGIAFEALDGITAQLRGGESPTIVNRKYFIGRTT